MQNITIISLLLAVLITCGCTNDTEKTDAVSDSATGELASNSEAWLGKGTFYSQNGTQSITAQLELLPDNTYRFLIIEPRILMMMGVEKGTWVRADGKLDLAPYPGQQTSHTGVLSRVPKDFRPKTLTIQGDESVMVLKDDKMDLQFKPNLKATMKLRNGGEDK